MDEELQCIRRASDVTRVRRARRQPAAASSGRTSWPPSWKYDIISKMWLRQSMHMYLKNNPTNFVLIRF